MPKIVIPKRDKRKFLVKIDSPRTQIEAAKRNLLIYSENLKIRKPAPQTAELPDDAARQILKHQLTDDQIFALREEKTSNFKRASSKMRVTASRPEHVPHLGAADVTAGLRGPGFAPVLEFVESSATTAVFASGGIGKPPRMLSGEWGDPKRWREFLLRINEKGERLGKGNFNNVFDYGALDCDDMPPVPPSAYAVVRTTRTDAFKSGETRWSSKLAAMEELAVSLFVASRDAAPTVYAGFLLKMTEDEYCLTLVLAKRTGDLVSLQLLGDGKRVCREAELAALACLELYASIADAGLCLFDVKPANVLYVKQDDGTFKMSACDFDNSQSHMVPAELRDSSLFLMILLMSMHQRAYAATRWAYYFCRVFHRILMEMWTANSNNPNFDWLRQARLVRNPDVGSFSPNKILSAARQEDGLRIHAEQICYEYFFNKDKFRPPNLAQFNFKRDDFISGAPSLVEELLRFCFSSSD